MSWVDMATARLDGLIELAVAALGALPFAWARYDFMGRALLALLLLAPATAMVSVFVVNLRMAFFSDAVAHSAFAGVALGFLLTAAGVAWAHPSVTVPAVGLVVAVLITAVKRRTSLGTDTVIGVAFSAVTALGIAIITRQRETANFNAFLYGDILLLDTPQVRALVLLAGAIAVLMLLAYNRLLLMAFNEDLARSRRTATRAYDYAFALLVALLVTASVRITGIVLITAMLVIPAATARNVARSAGSLFWIAMAVALASSVGGLAVSYYLTMATGAGIILLGTLLFAASMLVPRRGRGVAAPP